MAVLDHRLNGSEAIVLRNDAARPQFGIEQLRTGANGWSLAFQAQRSTVGAISAENDTADVVHSLGDGSQDRFYHGTRGDLMPGDLIEPGYRSNYGSRKKANHVYLTATVDAAVWGAELAVGDGLGRIYLVEPTGPIEDDPNLTDKKFAGNPTKSFRSRDPLRVTGELKDWEGHSTEVLQAMKDNLERLKRRGIEAIDD